VISGDNVEEIKSKSNALAQVAMKLGEAMYKSQQADQAAGAAAGAAGTAGAAPGDAANKDEKVVDADFEDVTDQKNKKTG
jgi:molecular chaperone DnaK